MAKVGEEEVEYESDPEEEKNLLGMRRRKAASDDEEEEEEEQKARVDRRAPIQSDESDGQGGAADYEEDELDEEEELEEEYEEVYEDEEEGAYEEEYAEGGEEREAGEREGQKERSEGKVEGERNGEAEEGEGAGEKKENEPFAVPTAGAFYMHDDRFRDNAGGRHRRTYGGRKLWESKDDKKWGHDKFEEMSMQERHYDQGRRGFRGNYRGRGGKNRGPERGYARRNRSKTFSNGNNQSPAPKGVRGRGPRKYEPVYKNGSQTSQPQNKQPRKPPEKTSYGNSGRVPPPASNTESDQVQPTKKHSSLSSASPPFYPSGSSNKDIPLTQKRDVQAGSTSRSVHTPFVDETFSMQQGNALSRGKNVADSVGIDKLSIDDSVNATTGNILNNIQASLIASSPVNATQSTQSRVQGRGAAVPGQMTYQASGSHNVGNRISPSTQLHTTQRNPSQGRGQTSNQAPGQQGGLRSGSGSQASSPPKSSISVNSNDPGEAETNSELSKSRNALVGKGKAGNQGSGRGSFLYGGAQVMGAAGNMGVGHGDQNFPAFLPFMQFGSQHPGGIGVPAVGMAFPGYVAQPQLGLGNSEMTWLPVLAGAAGALGATYCSPYIAVDGAYHARPSGQTPSLGSSSKENNTNKTNNDLKPSQKPEVTNDEFGQRQKPRRYSEMDFKQPSTSA